MIRHTHREKSSPKCPGFLPTMVINLPYSPSPIFHHSTLTEQSYFILTHTDNHNPFTYSTFQVPNKQKKKKKSCIWLNLTVDFGQTGSYIRQTKTVTTAIPNLMDPELAKSLTQKSASKSTHTCVRAPMLCPDGEVHMLHECTDRRIGHERQTRLALHV